MLCDVISFLFLLNDATAADSVWEVPNFLNTAFSGFLTLLLPVFVRLVFARPNLRLSFDNESGDVVKGVYMPVDSTLVRYQNWYRIRVENTGLLKLTNPRVWCVSMTAGSPSFSSGQPFTPFELNWAETDKDFQIGVIVKGKFRYRLDLCYIDTAKIVSSSLQELNHPGSLILCRRNKYESIQLLAKLPYDLCFVITNNNFLVPAQFAHVRINWIPDPTSSLPSNPSVSIQIVHTYMISFCFF